MPVRLYRNEFFFGVTFLYLWRRRAAGVVMTLQTDRRSISLDVISSCWWLHTAVVVIISLCHVFDVPPLSGAAHVISCWPKHSQRDVFSMWAVIHLDSTCASQQLCCCCSLCVLCLSPHLLIISDILADVLLHTHALREKSVLSCAASNGNLRLFVRLFHAWFEGVL